MYKSFPLLLVAAGLLLLVSENGLGQTGGYAFPKANDSSTIRGVVESYLRYDRGHPMPIELIHSITTGELAARLDSSHGVPIRFETDQRYRITGIRSIREDGTKGVLAMTVDVDSLRFFGPVSIDWMFFTERTDDGWRIGAVRRLAGVEDIIVQFHALDSSSYPLALKKIMAREMGRTLLSNEQLRANFLEHRGELQALAGEFVPNSKLVMIGRDDKVITQINNVGIQWGVAAKEIPREVIDSFLPTLSPAQQKEFREQLRGVEKMRQQGFDSLARIATRIGVAKKRLDTIVTLMNSSRVSFINAKLPWNSAVQFTVGGHFDDVVGYLYSPKGELPLVSPREYFYLEQIADGWWMFRST